MHVKQSVQALLDRLPDDCSLDDVQYHLLSCSPLSAAKPTPKSAARFPTKR